MQCIFKFMPSDSDFFAEELSFPVIFNEIKYKTQLTTRSAGSVQCFPGVHSLRLAFGSFFSRLILAVFCCSFKTFFFLRCRSSATLGFLCNRCFFVIWGDNLGGTFVSAFGHGFCLGVSSAISRFESSTTALLRCSLETDRLLFCVHLPSSQAAHELSDQGVHEISGEAVFELSGEAVHELSGEAVLQLGGEAVHELGSQAVLELSGEAVHDLSGTAVNELSGEAVHELGGGTVLQLGGEAVHELSSEAVLELSGEAVHELSGAAVNELSGKAVHKLNGEAVLELSGETIQELSGEAVLWLSGEAV